MPLIRSLNIGDADGFYEQLVNAQRAFDDAQAQRFMAKFALILANHVGDAALLEEAIKLAQRNTEDAAHAASA